MIVNMRNFLKLDMISISCAVQLAISRQLHAGPPHCSICVLDQDCRAKSAANLEALLLPSHPYLSTLSTENSVRGTIVFFAASLHRLHTRAPMISTWGRKLKICSRCRHLLMPQHYSRETSSVQAGSTQPPPRLPTLAFSSEASSTLLFAHTTTVAFDE